MNDIAVEKKLIMVVDDDATVRYMSRTSLEQNGFEVVDFDNGEEALEQFPHLSPNAVMLDVGLPGIDGYTVCEQIRKHPQGQLIPIMMLTGLQDIESINRAYQAGATDFDTKPMNWSLLPHRMLYLIRSNVALAELHKSRLRLLNAKNIADISDWEYDIENDSIYWSPELFQLLEIDPNKLIQSHEDILNYIYEEDVPAVASSIQSLFSHHKGYDVEYRVITENKKLVYVQERTRVIHDAGGYPVCFSGTIQDVTKRKMAEEEIHYLAYYDILTGLANRALFTEHLRTGIERAKRNSTSLAVLFLDLDNFKRINDSLGHDAGDQLLREVSLRLQQCLREYDVISREAFADITPIARFGGDEFIILLEDVTIANATHTAQRLLEVLTPNVKIDYHEVPLSASIGIAIYPDNGLDESNLLKNADTAMFRAKELGKNNFRFYDKSMNELALKKLRMERDLQSSINNDELLLLYQPKVSLKSGRIVGAEALIRWNHPSMGLISPVDFIPMAEENHLIKKIGRWVIDNACQQLKKWHARGYHDLHVAVNLSAGDFSEPTLVEFVSSAISRSRIKPECLELELTERMLMENLEHTLEVLRSLKNLGVKLSVDDFGTGYSSLRYLSQFPVDTLKIDQSFVANLPDNKNDAMITEAIIGLAHSLAMNVVAEGIETYAQRQFLQAKDCELMQGHLFSRALPADKFEALLEDQEALVA